MEQTERRKERAAWSLDHAGRSLPGGEERSDAARNRQRVVDAALRLFGERGVTNVTMEEVAREAGVGKGTLYRRFANKGLLCEALLDEPTRRFQAEVLVSLGDAERGPMEKLRGFLDTLVRFTEQNLDLLYGGHETLQGAGRVARYGHPSYGWMRWTVLGLLCEAVREGEIPPSSDVEYLAEALLAPLNVDLYYHQSRVLGLSSDRISAGLRSLASSL